MYVKLSMVVNNMTYPEEKVVYDLYAEDFLWAKEILPDSEGRYIEVPPIDFSGIITEYIGCFKNRRLKNLLETKASSSTDAFYKEIYRMGLDRDFYDFRTRRENEIAAEWCNKNNIKYTNKKDF